LHNVFAGESILVARNLQRILVTGASGLLGSKLVAQARRYFNVVSTYRTESRFPNSVRMDITKESDVRRAFSSFKPNVVVHAAAETNVDRCEADKERAWRVNVGGTKNIADMSNVIGARMLYVSTDYVFSGEQGLYTERDAPNPVNHYGTTKLEGERYVTRTCREYTIARTSVLYGQHPSKSNFAKWVITALEESEPISVVDDHYNSPTLASNLAEAILEMIQKNLNGLYHMTGSERITRFDFALRIANNFDLDSSLIKPLRMSELKAWAAKRPRDSSLRIDKIQKQIKTKLLDVNAGLKRMKRETA
jgi:dTDP-4-dehydrorhamnose reductase